MVALELGWGAPLAAPLFAFFNRTQHPIALEITSRSRPTSAGRRGWLSEDSVTGFSQAILFAGMVLPKWDNLCSTYGLRHSAQYLVRANTTAVIEYRARDLAIALERLVKSSRTNKGETLNEGLLRLLRVATMPADSLQREVKTFVQLRNALAHEGTFDIERSGRRLESNARAMHNLTDWLQTFVLRVILSLADWPGLVRDFGALQRVARPPRSLQFVRPKGKLS